MPYRPVDAGSVDFDQNLVGSDLGSLDVSWLQYVGAAIPGLDDSPHRGTPHTTNLLGVVDTAFRGLGVSRRSWSVHFFSSFLESLLVFALLSVPLPSADGPGMSIMRSSRISKALARIGERANRRDLVTSFSSCVLGTPGVRLSRPTASAIAPPANAQALRRSRLP